MTKCMRMRVALACGLALAVCITGCTPKLKVQKTDDPVSTVQGAEEDVDVATYAVRDTFTVAIPDDCRMVEDKLNADIMSFVTTPEGERIPRDADIVRIEVIKNDSIDEAEKGVEHSFDTKDDMGIHYEYSNVQWAELGGHKMGSADQEITSHDDDGNEVQETRKIVVLAVEKDGKAYAYQITCRGWTAEYRDSIMESIALL